MVTIRKIERPFDNLADYFAGRSVVSPSVTAPPLPGAACSACMAPTWPELSPAERRGGPRP